MPARRGGGGMGGQLMNVIWLLVVAGLVLGWAKVNNINNVGEAVDYFRAWAEKADSCAETVVENERPGGCGNTIDPLDPGTPIDPGLGGDLDDSPVPIEETKEKLLLIAKKLKVSPPAEISYNRAEWRHWSDLDRNGCDQREDTLIKQGENVKVDPATCKVLSGVWIDPYSGKEFTVSSSLDIDHVIPLSYAARHGGQNWSPAKKEQFANDPLNLLISSASENRKKGDKGPSKYLPPQEKFLCSYSSLWVKVAQKYDLSVAEADKKVLSNGLGSCG